MASVELERVDRRYPGGYALQDLSLSVEDGELLVLVGPSGCGKSTVLRLLAGLDEPTAGTLRIGEQVVNGMAPQERNVAMVFQDYALYPHLTVRGNLEFPLRMRRLDRAQIAKRVQWAAGVLGMTGWLDRLPRQLSGGQRQRVAMGRALVREPSVFLLDEPLSNLDPALRVTVRAEIGELQRRLRTTMLYVTHDQVEAMTLGHRVAILERGRLQQIDTPQVLYERPANVFVAGFIGSPPMNLIPAEVRREAGEPSIELAGWRLPLQGARYDPGMMGTLAGSTITAGIRPEALHLKDADAAEGLPARVEDAEYLGHEVLLRLGLPGHATPWIVRVAGSRGPARGDAVRLQFGAADLHLFAADGQALPQS